MRLKASCMRAITLLVGLLLLLSLAGHEALWRLNHPLVQQSTVSPNGFHVADVRLMPERSPVPYGVGVFLHTRWGILMSLQSELAFAGYCRKLSTLWPGDRSLVVHCDSSADTPQMLVPLVNGIDVAVQKTHK